MVIQVTTENFQQEIVEASNEKAIVLLFSSGAYPDCVPYTQLLGSLSTSLNFTLGVVSCDERENMNLVQMLRVQSVPEVYVVFKGEIADAIKGIVSEDDLKKRLEKFFVSDEMLWLQNLEAAITEKRFDEALPLLESALQQKPDDKHLTFLWAKASLGLGDIEKTKMLLEKFTETDDDYKQAHSMLELLEFYAEASKTDIATGAAENFHNACVLATQEQFEESLQQFLNLYTENPDWNEGAAKKAMLTLFGVLGPKHELTWKFRAKLNTLMFI